MFRSLSNIKAYKDSYKYSNIIFELSTILSKNILITYRINFIKVKDLAYFNKLKKYNKVWNYDT